MDDWRNQYKSKLVSPQQAIKQIEAGNRVFLHTGCAEPQILIEELARQAGRLFDAELVQILQMGSAPYAEKRLQDSFRANALFIGPGLREAVAGGRADYTPVFLSKVPSLFYDGLIHLDVALLQISPPDDFGYCSLGISVDVSKAAAEKASIVIAEVNQKMPRTLGDSFISVDKIDFLIESHRDLLEYLPQPTAEVARAIAKNVAKLIDNGSTLQLGIGTIPDALLPFLQGKKALGIHTEMLSDGVMHLVREGVITNAHKSIHRGKAVCSFAMGSGELYAWMHNNPMLEVRTSDYVNNPSLIAQNKKMVAINSALEVDLTGQVCVEGLGSLPYGGIGGHVDFMRGAAGSEGGKPIIALPSTAKGETISRIVPSLMAGAGVVLGRADVHYIVTEYGIASLFGKNLRERAVALIAIAHPDYREELLREAKRLRFVYPDQLLPQDPGTLYPEECEISHSFEEVGSIFFRPIKPTDESLLKELYYSASVESLQRRFFGGLRFFPHEALMPQVIVDYEEEMAIIGLLGPHGHEQACSLGQYFLDRASGLAEVAFVVRDDYQGHGIGTFMLNHLIMVAKSRGIKGFIAEVLPENKAMMAVFHKSGYEVIARFSEGTYSVRIQFDKPV
ncbi:MAG: GNAT family N-acetyltransferase [Candidatus Heimdallarchaeota archaeon]